MLPTELNEAILDHLTDEPHTLAMCARAHRSLLTLSHQRLFADIRINFDWQAASSCPAQILAALNASPYLGTYVRRFTVSCEGAWFRICAHILPPIVHYLLGKWPRGRYTRPAFFRDKSTSTSSYRNWEIQRVTDQHCSTDILRQTSSQEGRNPN